MTAIILNVSVGNSRPRIRLPADGALECAKQLVFVKLCTIDGFLHSVGERSPNVAVKLIDDFFDLDSRHWFLRN